MMWYGSVGSDLAVSMWFCSNQVLSKVLAWFATTMISSCVMRVVRNASNFVPVHNFWCGLARLLFATGAEQLVMKPVVFWVNSMELSVAQECPPDHSIQQINHGIHATMGTVLVQPCICWERTWLRFWDALCSLLALRQFVHYLGSDLRFGLRQRWGFHKPYASAYILRCGIS